MIREVFTSEFHEAHYTPECPCGCGRRVRHFRAKDSCEVLITCECNSAAPPQGEFVRVMRMGHSNPQRLSLRGWMIPATGSPVSLYESQCFYCQKTVYRLHNAHWIKTVCASPRCQAEDSQGDGE